MKKGGMALGTKVLSDRFKVFANQECKGSSRLYEELSLNIANDEDLLEIAAKSRQGQPIPNLFLCAVHYLLLKGKHHELREYYPSIAKHHKDPTEAFTYFRDFCLQYKKDIIPLLKNKLVQTNEVRRCAYLYPSFCFIYEKVKKPLALIEIGTSAGLQLLWDQYRYSYHTNEVYGNVNAELEIISELRGEGRPSFLKNSPPVVSRIGIDLHVNHLEDPEDYLWLKSLIWPEHAERLSNFEAAARCLKRHSLELIQGNGVALLSEIASKIPQDTTICIFHTHVANQFSKDDKRELIERIQKLGEKRDVFHIYNNMWDMHLHLDYYMDGELHQLTLAETDGHARWFTWKL
jgi:hypothetical protein